MKRITYTVALLLGTASMLTELWFGSPTQQLVPAVAAFDRFVFPIFIAAMPLLYWLMIRSLEAPSRLRVERSVSVVYSIFFVSKFGLALASQPSAASLAFVESWYWLLLSVWLLSFLAFDYHAALPHSLGVYSATLTLHVVTAWTKSAGPALLQSVPDIVASHLRLGMTLALVVLLGRIKHQWVVAEEEAKALRDVAHLDPLTQLPNRRHLNETLLRLGKGAEPFSVILFDLDGFKNVNDQFGHTVGDRILIRIASVAKATVNGKATIGRWGGEEFLIACPVTNLADAVQLAEHVRQTFHSLDTAPVHRITASFGVAERRPGETVEQLVHRADKALYAAKEQGKDTVVGAGARGLLAPVGPSSTTARGDG